MRLDLYRGGVACFNFSYSDSHLDLLTFKETIVTNTKTTRCILLIYMNKKQHSYLAELFYSNLSLLKNKLQQIISYLSSPIKAPGLDEPRSHGSQSVPNAHFT